MLGVNIDHCATVRQARYKDFRVTAGGIIEPDPVFFAQQCELAGADSITVHLREDRRHIQDRDVERLGEVLRLPLNLEMAATEAMLDFALAVKPDYACIVPENRREVTTEGGLNLASASVRNGVATALRRLEAAGTRTSLFIDPDPDALEHSAGLGAHAVELHTGEYANAGSDAERASELARLATAAEHGHGLGLAIHAGHGLTYENVVPVAALPHIEELNIGHSVVSRAVLVGLERAVGEMKAIVLGAPDRVPGPGAWVPPKGF